jgi:hypothetical protein
MNNSIGLMIVVLTLLMVGKVNANEQSFEITSANVSAVSNGIVEANVSYRINELQAVNGFAFRIHYKGSDIASFETINHFEQGSLGISSAVNDIEDLDDNPETDMYIIAGWFDPVNSLNINQGQQLLYFKLVLADNETNFTNLTISPLPSPSIQSKPSVVIMEGEYSIGNLATDDDGLDDVWEMLYFNNLESGPEDDNDHDGLTNLEEYQLGTNPTKADTDDDNYTDTDEVLAGSNPLNSENLPLDTDGDFISNVTDDDDDNDGVLDVDDAFPLDATQSQNSTQLKVKNDVDGDGKSDLLWRSEAKGWNFLWAMDGVQTKQASPINVVQDEGWLMAGQGDYDADGKSDILWRNTFTGLNFIYLMDGLNIKTRQVLNYVDAPKWELRGSGDFNDDGKGDVLWRNVDRGDTWFYMMDGLNVGTSQPSLWVTDLNYKIVAIGDINGDGTDDVIWRNQVTGVNYIWIMDNGQIANRYVLNAINGDWTIAGAGDLDWDGTDDIILRNQVDGRNWAYLMENGQIKTSEFMSTVGSLDWQIVDMGDYDGDGKADLLWRNETTTRNIVHLMDGLTIKDKGVLRPTDNTWQLAQ